MHPEQKTSKNPRKSKKFLGEREEQLLELLSAHGRPLAVLPALLQPGGYHLESRPVERLGDRRELGHDVPAAAVVLDHVNHAIELAPGALEPHQHVLADRRVDFHSPMIPQYPLGYRIPHGPRARKSCPRAPSSPRPQLAPGDPGRLRRFQGTALQRYG